MKIYELETKNGRIFRVGVTNRSQEKRLNKKIAENKKRYYEVFTRIECVKNGIHNIKDFEALVDTLV
jgi:hypothetical protein